MAGEVDPAGDPLLGELAVPALLCNDATASPRAGLGWSTATRWKGARDARGARRVTSGSGSAQLPRVDEIPFDAQHRFMATLHHGTEVGGVAFVKGAPERLLAMCGSALGGGRRRLDAAYWHSQVDLLASRAASACWPSRPAGCRGRARADLRRGRGGLTMLGLSG